MGRAAGKGPRLGGPPPRKGRGKNHAAVRTRKSPPGRGLLGNQIATGGLSPRVVLRGGVAQPRGDRRRRGHVPGSVAPDGVATPNGPITHGVTSRTDRYRIWATGVCQRAAASKAGRLLSRTYEYARR